MKPNIAIFGAGGHTRSLIPLIRSNGFNISAIFDDSFNIKNNEYIDNIPVIGKINDFNGEGAVVLSFGDGEIRRKLHYQFKKYVLKDNLVHPSVIKDVNVKMLEGNQIFPGVFLNALSCIGSGNIINTMAVVEHETKIGDFNHLSVGCIIAGRVNIGNNCFIGAGAVIIDKISIVSDVIIGANAVVINDIREPGTYVGNPVRKIK